MLTLYRVIVLVAVMAVCVIAVVSIISVIAIMVAAKLTVLAILAVAIHIAILLLRHINAVDDDGNFWKFLFFGNLIDNRQTCLRRVVCTANVNCGVSNPADMECVCYQTDRSRINKDVLSGD